MKFLGEVILEDHLAKVVGFGLFDSVVVETGRQQVLPAMHE